jgi:hypothetical protein
VLPHPGFRHRATGQSVAEIRERSLGGIGLCCLDCEFMRQSGRGRGGLTGARAFSLDCLVTVPQRKRIALAILREETAALKEMGQYAAYRL